MLLCEGGCRCSCARRWRAREVSFRALDDELLDWYVATGEWRERSGGYAIQGQTGARLALQVRGEEENVVGLPLATLLELYPELSKA